jgi:uncharacterized protein YndB with AHSA1/START domain
VSRIRLVNKVFIEGSIDDVWSEITKRDEPQRAFFNMKLDSSLDVGSKMHMRSGDGKYTGVAGEVLAFDPPHRYSHTFRFTNYDDPPCRVTYELKEVKGGVEFTLITDDLEEGTETAKQMKSGGKMICDCLKAIVEKGDVPFGVRMMFVMFKLMEPFTPKKSLSENWR